MEKLKIALLQYAILWENPEGNFQQIDAILKGVEADIFLLPEMFSTGFTMNPEVLAEPFCGPSFQFLQQKAIEKNAVFAASIPTKIGADFLNRLYWVEPNETFTFYDKRHLFGLAGEDKHYTAGNDRKWVDYQGWKLMLQVCYDLRFPVWSRNNVYYDVLIYLANWPEKRRYPWNQLLTSRAIENMAYTVGVNRIGEDGNGIAHSGDSMIYDPLGYPMDFEQPNPQVLVFELSKEKLNLERRRFKFLNDADEFEIKN